MYDPLAVATVIDPTLVTLKACMWTWKREASSPGEKPSPIVWGTTRTTCCMGITTRSKAVIPSSPMHGFA